MGKQRTATPGKTVPWNRNFVETGERLVAPELVALPLLLVLFFCDDGQMTPESAAAPERTFLAPFGEARATMGIVRAGEKRGFRKREWRHVETSIFSTMGKKQLRRR